MAIDDLGARLARSVELRARCDKQTLQRYVGFEVELSVPTFGNVEGPVLQESSTGAKAPATLRTWFGGGLDREDLGKFDVPGVKPIER